MLRPPGGPGGTVDSQSGIAKIAPGTGLHATPLQPGPHLLAKLALLTMGAMAEAFGHEPLHRRGRRGHRGMERHQAATPP